MNKPNHTCKICGKKYYFCQGCQVNRNFDWKKVACCKEHADEYFGLVRIARGENIIQVEEKVEIPNNNGVDDAESSTYTVKRGRKSKVNNVEAE